jgi:hypothetical protein
MKAVAGGTPVTYAISSLVMTSMPAPGVTSLVRQLKISRIIEIGDKMLYFLFYITTNHS